MHEALSTDPQGEARTHETRRALEQVAGHYHDDMDLMVPLAREVLDQVDEIDLDEPYPEDQANEIADAAVPVLSREIFGLMPALFRYEISDPGLFYGEETTLERLATVLIWDWLMLVAADALARRQDNRLEDRRRMAENSWPAMSERDQ